MGGVWVKGPQARRQARWARCTNGHLRPYGRDADKQAMHPPSYAMNTPTTDQARKKVLGGHF